MFGEGFSLGKISEQRPNRGEIAIHVANKGRSSLEEEIESAKAMKCTRKNKATSVDRAEGMDRERYQMNN